MKYLDNIECVCYILYINLIEMRWINEDCFSVILVIASIVIIFAVMSQETKSEGMAALTGETNVGGHGGRLTKDNYINRVVVVSSVIFLVSALALAYIK